MERKILIRYGEIGLKSDFVRRQFEKRLISNIKSAVEVSISKERGRILIEKDDPGIYPILKRIFGIVSFSPCMVTKSDIKSISALALSAIENLPIKTFALVSRRHGTHEFTSQEVNEKVGKIIVKKTGLKVNLSNPDKTVFIEVRDKTYIYTEKIKGPGGLPLGTQGKAIALIEDSSSVAAAWMIMKRGCEIIPILKNKKYLDILEKWGGEIKSYVSDDFSDNFIEKVMKMEGVSCLVTSTPNPRKPYLVLTPVAGLSKQDIDDLIEKITV